MFALIPIIDFAKARAGVLSVALCMGLGMPVNGADKPKLPDGPGKDTTERLCGSCHGVGLMLSKRESRDGWSGIVEDMIRRGAKGSDDEFGEAVDYLAATFSKSTPAARININEASEKQLVSALGISQEQGKAVVQHREAKGKFSTIDDLLKVPGIDAAAVEAKKSIIDF
ncbi:MAG: helix-hairpin-helix domain-containing protein [Bryobacteraceae bacterium]|nr:helix-hairpin-helix domain-containing protein [Bryobacteraceae bacterium]